MRGRKRQPTAVKKLKGTADPRWVNPDEPTPDVLDSIPPPPVSLDIDELKIWNDSCRYLKEVAMLHGIDLQSLAMYCREMATYHRCMDIVRKEGVVKEFENGAQRMDQINPYYKVAKMALENANKIADKFGFNPSARASLKASPQKTQSAGMSLIKLAK